MMKTEYPPVPGGGSWSWDEDAKAWRAVTPEEANAELDRAAGLAPPPAPAPAPAPTSLKTTKPSKGDES